MFTFFSIVLGLCLPCYAKAYSTCMSFCFVQGIWRHLHFTTECTSLPRVCEYPGFFARLTRYSALLEMNVGGSKLPFSEAPSFLFSYIPVLTIARARVCTASVEGGKPPPWHHNRNTFLQQRPG